MKRILRKVASIFVATAMVAALGVSAMAAELPEEGVTGDKNPATALETTLVIQKDLKVYNPSADEVYGPGVSYTYTIGAGSAEKEITDVDGVKALTKAGVGTPTITGSVAYPNNEKVDAAPAGESNLKPIEINFANVTFPGAGVYRYVVTERCSNKAAVGVVGDNATETVRYLDVYVRDPKDGETGYKIYGYVLFAVDDDIDGSTAASNNLDDVVKTQGFVDTTTGSGSGAATLKADAYYTYNLEVKKTLVNDAANNDHGFPFTLTFTKPDGVSGNFNLISSDGDPLAMDASITTTIANGNSVTYTGIPCGTTVGISEKTDLSNVMLEPQDNTDPVTVTTTKGAEGEDKTVEFTNEYVLISPTGVALAILPFVILFTFGVGFLVAGTAKRKEDEA